MCILFLYTLLKIASHNDSSVLSMSVMGFQKEEVWIGGGCWGQCYPHFLWNFVNFAKPLNS